jgi:arginyl-tRNA synthetase
LKDTVAGLIERALDALVERGVITHEARPEVRVERARQRGHGDFASNVALTMAKAAGRPPRELAGDIVAALPDHPALARTEIAGPGFINFCLAADARTAVVARILDAGRDFGRSTAAGGERRN